MTRESKKRMQTNLQWFGHPELCPFLIPLPSRPSTFIFNLIFNRQRSAILVTIISPFHKLRREPLHISFIKISHLLSITSKLKEKETQHFSREFIIFLCLRISAPSSKHEWGIYRPQMASKMEPRIQIPKFLGYWWYYH